MKRNSLRWRVTSFYVGMLAVALIVFSVAVYLSVKAFLIRSLERSLETSASSILTDYVKPLSSKGLGWFRSEMSESYPQGITDTLVRVSRDGEVLYQNGEIAETSNSAENLSASNRVDGTFDLHRARLRNGQEMMLCRLPYRTVNGGFVLIETGGTTEPSNHILRSLFLILLTATPLVLLIAAIGGYLLMSRPLRPVVTLTRQAERVGREDLGERLPVIRSGDELERLSLALNRMIDRLEHTLAHNRRFSADASHELRTPLTIIRGELEVLLQTPMLPTELAEGIASALEESGRMSHLIESLMTISRLEGGGEQMEMVPLDLVSIARSTLEHMSLLAEEKEIQLLCEAHGTLLVMGDPMRLKQVIVNLTDNAIKYTPSRGRVRLTIRAVGARAVLEVRDTGAGIPVSALPLIFERFYRADPARSRDSGGVGLGLSIVKSICIAHHGTVSATSAVNEGTTLRIELPLLQDRIREGYAADGRGGNAEQELSKQGGCRAAPVDPARLRS